MTIIETEIETSEANLKNIVNRMKNEVLHQVGLMKIRILVTIMKNISLQNMMSGIVDTKKISHIDIDLVVIQTKTQAEDTAEIQIQVEVTIGIETQIEAMKGNHIRILIGVTIGRFVGIMIIEVMTDHLEGIMIIGVRGMIIVIIGTIVVIVGTMNTKEGGDIMVEEDIEMILLDGSLHILEDREVEGQQDLTEEEGLPQEEVLNKKGKSLHVFSKRKNKGCNNSYKIIIILGNTLIMNRCRIIIMTMPWKGISL